MGEQKPINGQASAQIVAGWSSLIVDDDDFILGLTARMLKRLGIEQVEKGNDGHQALAQFDALDGDVDLILCDLNMPGMDGLEFLRHLAERNCRSRIILASGEDRRLVASARNLAGTHGLQVIAAIEKPISMDELENALAGHAAISSVPDAPRESAITAAELEQAIDEDWLLVNFQPQIDLVTLKATGVEALVRLKHPMRGFIGPNEFIPLAEQSGLIGRLTRFVICRSFDCVGDWKVEGLDLNISINAPVAVLQELDLPDFLIEQASANGLEPAQVTLEITETQLVDDAVSVQEVLTRLRMKGINLSIDDFGTGYSSMEQLKKVPFTEIKIDKQFVSGAASDPEALAICESSLSLSKKLGLLAVAEGIETEQELFAIRDLGCDLAQGYFLGRPMPASEIVEWHSDWSERAKTLMSKSTGLDASGKAIEERRIVAVAAIDVVGYSRLMNEDESGTLTTWMDHRATLIDPGVGKFMGRIVSTAGDGLLVEFPSVVNAVSCAVEVQKAMAERNGVIVEERKMRLRFGINVGDVIVRDGDIFGNGVNVAARLESIAEPGSICVSQTIYEQFQHNEQANAAHEWLFEDIGEQCLKNIEEPVHAFKIAIEEVSTARIVG